MESDSTIADEFAGLRSVLEQVQAELDEKQRHKARWLFEVMARPHRDREADVARADFARAHDAAEVNRALLAMLPPLEAERRDHAATAREQWEASAPEREADEVSLANDELARVVLNSRPEHNLSLRERLATCRRYVDDERLSAGYRRLARQLLEEHA